MHAVCIDQEKTRHRRVLWGLEESQRPLKAAAPRLTPCRCTTSDHLRQHQKELPAARVTMRSAADPALRTGTEMIYPGPRRRLSNALNHGEGLRVKHRDVQAGVTHELHLAEGGPAFTHQLDGHLFAHAEDELREVSNEDV